MIITQTPFRMSFFGGGTDFPEFFKNNGGAVISTSFDKYCYVNVKHLAPFFDWRTELTYSRIERVNEVDEIIHPAIREAMKFTDMHRIRLIYEADLPARSGLGTSSSFAVGMLNAFYALKGKYIGKQQLADQAIYLERVLCGEAGGIQDQIAASFGGLNRIDFSADGYRISPIIISPERKAQLNRNLLLFFTGFSRFSADIQKGTEERLEKKNSELKEILKLVDQAETILVNKSKNLDEFGELLDYTWRLKKGINNRISTETIDIMYETAIKAGALGGKLLGAGGGGFLLFYVPEIHINRVKKAMCTLKNIPFSFENEGTKILHYAPEDYIE